LITAVAAAAALSCAPVRAQVPVDWIRGDLHFLQQLMDNVNSLMNEVTQIDNQVAGLQRMDRDFAAVTGDRGWGAFQRNPGLDRYLPGDTLPRLDGVRDSGFEAMSNEARGLRGAGAPDPCTQLPQVMRLNCQAAIARPYEASALLRQVLGTQGQRLQQLRSLLDAVSTATDPQSVAQLHTRITGEQAMLAQSNEQVQTLRAMVENEDRIEAARRRQTTLEILDRTGGLRIKRESLEP
jgi:type IV secretion system protein VirB5